MGFSLSIYPFTYKACYTEDKTWIDEIQEKEHLSPQQEAEMTAEDHNKLLAKRNSFPDLPLVNYTTQYGMGCFEGIKAFPQKDGSIKIFRPDQNAARMARSMKGLMMPSMPEAQLVQGLKDMVRKNTEIGFAPKYNPEWEKSNFMDGEAVYIRPFSYSEAAIGLGISHYPYIIAVTTPVSSYFKDGSTAAVTSNRIRATKNGTGWIKCDSNYVISTLAKKEAEAQGYMEAIFLDAEERTYIEEGSSCNIFFYLKNGTLVTPALGDTILPGITRKSVITLAKDSGITVEERKISIEEAMADANECFVAGTAAGIAPLESITHNGEIARYKRMGDLTKTLLRTLKGIQYGAVEDKHKWMHSI